MKNVFDFDDIDFTLMSKLRWISLHSIQGASTLSSFLYLPNDSLRYDIIQLHIYLNVMPVSLLDVAVMTPDDWWAIDHHSLDTLYRKRYNDDTDIYAPQQPFEQHNKCNESNDFDNDNNDNTDNDANNKNVDKNVDQNNADNDKDDKPDNDGNHDDEKDDDKTNNKTHNSSLFSVFFQQLLHHQHRHWQRQR